MSAGRRLRRRVKKGGRGRAGAPILRARRGRRPACFAAWILHIYAQTVQAPVCAAGWAERGRAQEAAPTPDCFFFFPLDLSPPRQNTMNLLLAGALSLPVGYMAFGFGSLLVPPK